MWEIYERATGKVHLVMYNMDAAYELYFALSSMPGKLYAWGIRSHSKDGE